MIEQIKAFETEESKYHDVRMLVSSFGSKIFHVVFIKKDGTIRRMNVQQAAAVNHLKNNDDPAVKDMLAKRVRDNPSLINLWSINDKGFRSVSIDKIVTIHSGNKSFTVNQVDVK